MTGLEALKIVERDCEDLEQVPYGEFALIEKSLKALEIIKEKTVDIWLIQNKKTLKQYNSMVDESRQLTEEEFDLLKEVLE
jgi:hypothetical protein